MSIKGLPPKHKNGLISYSSLESYNLVSFTTSRVGGVSKGAYESMNTCLYSDDNVEDVMENRNLLAQYVGVSIENLFIPYQTHEDNIRLIDSNFLGLSYEKKERLLNDIDALITNEKDICIGITTADCVPILVYDPTNHALGVAHAGWKGTVQDIAGKMVKKMHELFFSRPSELIVAIGPSISQQMFEVGDEVGDAFIEEGFDLDTIAYRNAETGKLHVDLWQANKELLLDVGVKEEHIEIAGICSFGSENFFSARRQTIKSGRMLTGGVLK